MRIFVTDGDNRASLAVTRSLGRAGDEVIVGERRLRSLSHASRYCAEAVQYPDPITKGEDFVAFLADFVRDRQVDVILPVADITTFLVTRHRARFGSCAVPFAANDIVERAADKVALMATAARIGVPVPRSVVVPAPDQVPDHDLGFPLVIKPWKSRVLTTGGWLSSSVSYAAGPEALAADLSSRGAHEFPVMLQERIVGPGMGVFACYHQGRPVALFQHRRLRERPPWGGVSVLSQSVAVDPAAREFATKLLDNLGWHGIAMVEFKVDGRDGLPKLMEINGRFWGSLQLAIDAGVDFPALLVKTVTTGQFAPQAPYREGVRTRWFWGSVDSLILSLVGRWPGRREARHSRLNATRDFLRLVGSGLHYDNPKWQDPWPFVVESFRWLTQGLAVNAPRRSTAPTLSATPTRPAGSQSGTAKTRNPALSVRVASAFEETGLDARRWNELAARSGTNTLFQTYEWNRSWWKCFGDGRRPLFVVASRGTTVEGIASFVVDDRFTGTELSFQGHGRADYCDILAAATCSPAVVEAMVEALGESVGWNTITLRNMPADSQSVAGLQAACQRFGYRMLSQPQFVCPTLLIDGHEQQALDILNKPSLRRPLNYFSRAGRLVCRHLTRRQDIEPWLDAFFGQHIARWQKSGGRSLFHDVRNQRFYRELTASLSDPGWLLFSTVELNDRPLAFHFGFDYNGAIYWYKPAFDVAHAAHSPGLVMVRSLIAYAIENRRRELDFTIGDEAFKKRFTNQARQTVAITVVRDTARYLLARARQAAGAAARGRP